VAERNVTELLRTFPAFGLRGVENKGSGKYTKFLSEYDRVKGVCLYLVLRARRQSGGGQDPRATSLGRMEWSSD
jgi:hypothetical protein